MGKKAEVIILPTVEIISICKRNGLIINEATLTLLQQEKDMASVTEEMEKVFCPVMQRHISPNESAGIIQQCFAKHCGKCGEAILSAAFLPSRVSKEMELIQRCIRAESESHLLF